MRRLNVLAVALTATVLTSAAALAQQASPSTSGTQTTPAVPTVLTAQKTDEVLSDSYIGADVVARSPEGLERVGKVSELVLSEDDKIVGVVVDVGGFLGVGAKPVGLSWAALSEERTEGELMLLTSLTRAELEEAPEFKTLSQQQVDKDRKVMEEQEAPASQPLQ